MNASTTKDPRIGTPKSSAPKPNSVTTSKANIARRENRNDARYSGPHRRGDETLEQFLLARVDDREAEAPDAAAHDVHAEQAGHHEIDVARAVLAHVLIGGGDRVAATGAALHGVVDDEARGARFGARVVDSGTRRRRLTAE